MKGKFSANEKKAKKANVNVSQVGKDEKEIDRKAFPHHDK